LRFESSEREIEEEDLPSLRGYGRARENEEEEEKVQEWVPGTGLRFFRTALSRRGCGGYYPPMLSQ